MKKFSLLLFVLFVSLFLFSCGDKTEDEKVREAFMEAVENVDYKYVLAFDYFDRVKTPGSKFLSGGEMYHYFGEVYKNDELVYVFTIRGILYAGPHSGMDVKPEGYFDLIYPAIRAKGHHYTMSNAECSKIIEILNKKM